MAGNFGYREFSGTGHSGTAHLPRRKKDHKTSANSGTDLQKHRTVYEMSIKNQKSMDRFLVKPAGSSSGSDSSSSSSSRGAAPEEGSEQK